MDNVSVIKSIIAADRRGRNEAARARAEADGLEAALELERERLKASYFERAEKRIEAVREAEERYAADALQRLEAKLADDVAEARGSFAKHSDEWAEALFTFVLNEPEHG